MSRGRDNRKQASTYLRLVQADESLALADGLTSTSGEGFLQWLVTYLVDALDLELALIGEFPGPDVHRLRVLAVAGGDKVRPTPGSLYDLRQTPFNNIVAQSVGGCVEAACDEFPRDRFLSDHATGACAGVLLKDTQNQPIGLLSAFKKSTFSDDQAVIDTLRLFVARASGELQLERAARHLRVVAPEDTHGKGATLQSTVCAVAAELGVKVAFVSELADTEQLRARTLALCIDGSVCDNIEYELHGTPCEHVFEKPVNIYPSSVRELFPNDTFLGSVDAEGYLSIGFFSARGAPMGHLGVIHDLPLSQHLHSSPLLRVLAAHARAELEERRGARRLKVADVALTEMRRLRVRKRLADGALIRLLIVDDHQLVREGLKRIVAEYEDFQVIDEAVDGHEVIAKGERADVVLLDVSMPGPGFLETLRRLRKDYPSTRVLVLSVHPEDHYAVRAMRAGASGYLTKDHSPQELGQAIRRVASGGKYVTAELAEKLAVEVGGAVERQPHELLSDREYQVLRMLATGKSIKEIAYVLKVSPNTVSTYRARLLMKMQLDGNADLVRYVVERELGD